MHRIAPPLSLLLLLGAILPAQAAPGAKPLTPAHRIKTVTVYPDRALVTRTAALTLSPGTYDVTLGDLPIALDRQSIRLGGRGTASVQLHGHDLRTVYVGETPQAKITPLAQQLEKLKDQDRTLADRLKIQQQQREALEDLTRQVAPNLAKQLAVGKAKLTDWQAALAFVQTRLQQTVASVQQLEIQRRQLAGQIRTVEAQLQALQNYRRTETRQVPVTLAVAKGGSFELELTYAIGGASWRPSHEARLAANGKDLNWRAYGLISQKTGEDWEGVAIKLSTARPSQGGSAPIVPEWVLQPFSPPPVALQRSERYGAMAKSDMAPPAPMPLASTAEESREALVAEAQVLDQGTSVTLAVAGQTSIPSDGQPHQTMLGEFTAAAETEYKVVPRLDPAVYLDATLTNPAQWPLLAGPVRSYLDTTFVGTSQLAAAVAPGQRVELGLGVDDSITVKRTRTKRSGSEIGLLTKEQLWEYGYRIDIANHKGIAQTVSIIEPLPRAEAESIRIETAASHPAPARAKERHRLEWRLTVPAHTEKQIEWGYRVIHPRQMTILGLE